VLVPSSPGCCCRSVYARSCTCCCGRPVANIATSGLSCAAASAKTCILYVKKRKWLLTASKTRKSTVRSARKRLSCHIKEHSVVYS
jgi:hypothetical protein